MVNKWLIGLGIRTFSSNWQSNSKGLSHTDMMAWWRGVVIEVPPGRATFTRPLTRPPFVSRLEQGTPQVEKPCWPSERFTMGPWSSPMGPEH